MFYFLSKTIDFLVMPFSICFVLILYSIMTKIKNRKRAAAISGLLLLYLISNPFLVNKAFLLWEYKLVNVSEVDKVYDIGIVLSGGLINPTKRTSDHPALGSRADRFMQAFTLYKAGKIKKIFITGRDSYAAMSLNKGESREVARILVSWGVKADDIIFEERARNTSENALNAVKIIKQRFPESKAILITSSFHMRRSLGCFQKAGMAPDVFPSNFYGNDGSFPLKDMLFPHWEVLSMSNVLWHEWVGYVTYKIMGYC